jgi:hypothetical protein
MDTHQPTFVYIPPLLVRHRSFFFTQPPTQLSCADITIYLYNPTEAEITEPYFLWQVYVYILYPMSAVAFCASTYMTLAVTVERYIAVCRPHQYRTISQVR